MAEENESRKNDVRARALQGAEGGSVVTASEQRNVLDYDELLSLPGRDAETHSL